MVIDDSPTMLYMVEHMLSKDGHEVVTATDGATAVSLAVEQTPDLILLDVILPKLNGFEVCRQLKATEETKETPVVMITSKTKDKDRAWGIEQGADAYITKPFEEEDLLEIVDRFVPQAN
jgi:twitching motility two-component system response regulator PilH